jgi:hypothetical protein
MISKVKTIIFSRFKKPNKESFVEVRREICAKCEFSTKNIETLKWSVRVVKFFSDFYSFITLSKKVDTLGNCTACEICSIYYKTAEELEQCPAKPAKWKRVETNNKN